MPFLYQNSSWLSMQGKIEAMPTVCLRTTHILYPSRALLANMLLRHREPKRDETRLSPLQEAGRQAGRVMAEEGDRVLQKATWLLCIFFFFNERTQFREFYFRG